MHEILPGLYVFFASTSQQNVLVIISSLLPSCERAHKKTDIKNMNEMSSDPEFSQTRLA